MDGLEPDRHLSSVCAESRATLIELLHLPGRPKRNYGRRITLTDVCGRRDQATTTEDPAAEQGEQVC